MEPEPAPRISTAFRIALAVKALPLLGFAAIFGTYGFAIAIGPGMRPIRILGGLAFGRLVLFLAWAGARGLADAALGRAERASGAVALQSRRAGYSLQLPDGRFLEFILWNQWEALVPGERYTVTFGRRSQVLVRAPEREVTPPP